MLSFKQFINEAFGNCTRNAMNHYKKYNSDVYVGIVKSKTSNMQFPHAWNVHKGKLVGKSLKSHDSNGIASWEYTNAKQVPKNVLDVMQHDREIAVWHTKHLNEGWKRGNGLYKEGPKSKSVHHTDKVDGKDVMVQFQKGYNKDVGIHFTVDDRYHTNKSNDNGHKILHHIHKVIGHYIKKSKPASIRMRGNHPVKDNMYLKYGELIAKQHDGVWDDHWKQVVFPKNQSDK